MKSLNYHHSQNHAQNVKPTNCASKHNHLTGSMLRPGLSLIPKHIEAAPELDHRVDSNRVHPFILQLPPHCAHKRVLVKPRIAIVGKPWIFALLSTLHFTPQASL